MMVLFYGCCGEGLKDLMSEFSQIKLLSQYHKDLKKITKITLE